MNLKAPLGIFLGVAAIALSQYFYQPDLTLMLISLAILAGLWGLVLWSSTRVGSGAAALFKLGLVSAVASFMFSQALDVLYSLRGTPGGARFDLLPEVAIYGFGTWGLALLIRLFAFGPQEQK